MKKMEILADKLNCSLDTLKEKTGDLENSKIFMDIKI